jgi:L-alanine-DL-glutamate epimerase-like enolase superfamily enzyme
MRGFQRPAIRLTTTDSQSDFRALSRHRRTKLARTAHTTLLKADQWGRGDGVAAEVASALESALQALRAKAAKKK